MSCAVAVGPSDYCGIQSSTEITVFKGNAGQSLPLVLSRKERYVTFLANPRI